MKWNATIIVTFFNPHELTKFVLQSLQNFRVSSWNIWPRELNQKGFSSFSAYIQYRARLNDPFSFFGIVRLFSEKKFRNGWELHFLNVLRQNGYWKIPKGPFQFFWHRETFCFKKIFPFNFFDALQRWMLKNPEGSPFSALVRLEYLTLWSPFAVFDP